MKKWRVVRDKEKIEFIEIKKEKDKAWWAPESFRIERGLWNKIVSEIKKDLK